NLRLLRTPPEIHRRHAMHAADRAIWRARLRCREFPPDVLDRVAFERYPWITALLRTVVDEAVLADVEVARAGAAAPLIRLAVRQVVLKAANPRIEILEDLPGPVDRRRHFVVDLALGRSERLEAPRAVVDDADRGGEAQFARAVVDGARV